MHKVAPSADPFGARLHRWREFKIVSPGHPGRRLRMATERRHHERLQMERKDAAAKRRTARCRHADRADDELWHRERS